MPHRIKHSHLWIFLSIPAVMSCTGSSEGAESEEALEQTFDDADFEATDWTVETHANSAEPDFEEVFDNTAVKRIDIVVTSERWNIMLDNMADLYGEFGGTNSGPGSGPGKGTQGDRPNETLDSTENPVFVPAEFFYDGRQWYKVGIRFKGNSSLQSCWQQGILKLSLKLDFDEFEDVYPQIADQRFYGFKQLSLKNNYDDRSFLREKVAAEIFERAGVAVSHTAFYTLYVDHGDGPTYFGLYTLVEEVDNTVIDTQFNDDNGNLYKPEGTGASFRAGSFNEDHFEEKNVKEEGDWSDIQALFDALHSDTRISDPSAWRTDLEEIFDTEVFLRYLAVNTVIQNWDTYGLMTHNYYLYNNPDNNKLTWIPWDNNEALQEGKQGGALTLDFSDLQEGEWPLIEYIYADSVYREQYDALVKEITDGAFETTAVQSIYSSYATLVEPHALAEKSGYTFLTNDSDFQQAIDELVQHTTSRSSAVDDYLAN